MTATAKNVGAMPHLTISVTEGTTSTTSAAYTASSNTLTITLAENAQVTTAELATALGNNAVTGLTTGVTAGGSTTAAQLAAFLGSYNLTVGGINGATSIQTPDTTSLNSPMSAYGTSREATPRPPP